MLHFRICFTCLTPGHGGLGRGQLAILFVISAFKKLSTSLRLVLVLVTSLHLLRSSQPISTHSSALVTTSIQASPAARVQRLMGGKTWNCKKFTGAEVKSWWEGAEAVMARDEAGRLGQSGAGLKYSIYQATHRGPLSTHVKEAFFLFGTVHQ